MIEQFGVISVDVRMVASGLYLREAEQMPEDAPDEWFLPGGDDLSEYEPERVRGFLDSLGNLLDRLRVMSSESSAEEFQVEFYTAAKEAFGEDKTAIRTYFLHLYQIMFHANQGPRWGQFVSLFGKERFEEELVKRIGDMVPAI